MQPSQHPGLVAAARWSPFVMLAMSILVAWALIDAVVPAVWFERSLIPTAALVVIRGVGAVRRSPWPPPTGTVFVGVNLTVTLIGSLFNPFLCIYAFAGYLDLERFLSGRPATLATVGTALVTAVGQSGGFPGEFRMPWLFPLLALANLGIALLMLALRRDQARNTQAREQALRELAHAEAANAALQASLVNQAQQLGIDQERARLSREIHDTVAQGLVGVIRQLEAVSLPLNDEALTRIRRAEAVARDCLVDARRAVAALAPQQLENTTLSDALLEMTSAWAHTHRIVTQLDADEAPPASCHDAVLLRVAQEALTNVAKHAQAETVVLRLATVAGHPQLRVTDDGVGFDPTTAYGSGISGMKRRLAEVGGILKLDSSPGQGCTVIAEVPA